MKKTRDEEVEEPRILNSLFSIQSYDGGKEGRGYEVDNVLVCDRGSMQIHSSKVGAYGSNLVLKSQENIRITHIVLYSPHILPYACREGVLCLSKHKPNIASYEKFLTAGIHNEKLPTVEKDVFSTSFRTPKLLPQVVIKIPYDRDFKYIHLKMTSAHRPHQKPWNGQIQLGYISIVGFRSDHYKLSSSSSSSIPLPRALLPEISSVGTESGTLDPSCLNRLTPGLCSVLTRCTCVIALTIHTPGFEARRVESVLKRVAKYYHKSKKLDSRRHEDKLRAPSLRMSMESASSRNARMSMESVPMSRGARMSMDSLCRPSVRFSIKPPSTHMRALIEEEDKETENDNEDDTENEKSRLISENQDYGDDNCKDHVLFLIAGEHDPMAKIVQKMFGVQKFPRLVILQHSVIKYVQEDHLSLNDEIVKDMVDRLHDHDLREHLRSGHIKDENPESDFDVDTKESRPPGGVVRCVGRSFQSIVLDPRYDVLLFAYADERSHPIDESPRRLLEQLALVMRKFPDIIIASLNVSNNDIPGRFLPSRYAASLPRLTMFARNKKDRPIHFQEAYNHKNLMEFINRNTHATLDVTTLLSRAESLEKQTLDSKEAESLLEKRKRFLEFLENTIQRDTEEHVDDCDLLGELEVSSRRAVYEIESLLRSSKRDLENLLVLPLNRDPHISVWGSHASMQSWIRHLKIVCEDLQKLQDKYAKPNPIIRVSTQKEFLRFTSKSLEKKKDMIFVVAYLCESWDEGCKIVAKEIHDMALRFQGIVTVVAIDATNLRSELTYAGIWTVPTICIISEGVEIKRFEGPEVVGLRHFVEDMDLVVHALTARTSIDEAK